MNQFGSANPGNPQVCARCEALLMDVLDRAASPEDQTFFDRHLASCTSCSRMFVDAKRGEAWLSMLKQPRPEPAAGLLERILAQTSGASSGNVQLSSTEVGAQISLQTSSPSTEESLPVEPADSIAAVRAIPQFGAGLPPTAVIPLAPGTTSYLPPRHGPGSNVIPFRVRAAIHTLGQRMLQPRLAMTAAMAFFSIALTLNLTGVHVSELRAADLRPSNLRRGFYEANAHVVRYYDNLRVVYELEARVHDMQRSSDADAGSTSSSGTTTEAPQADRKPASGPEQKAQPDTHQPSEAKPRPKNGPGTSRREPLTPQSLFVAFRDRTNHTGHATISGQTFSTKGDLA